MKRSRPQAGHCGREAGHSGSEAGPSSPGGGRASPEPLWTLNPGWGEESAEFPDGDDGAAFPVRDVGALLHVVEVEGTLRSLAFRPAPISHKMSLLSSCRNQLPYKSVNLSFAITVIKNKLMDLCGR